MALSTTKSFTLDAFDHASFYNENREARVNIEGTVEIAGVSNIDITAAAGDTAAYIAKSSTATGGDFDVAYTAATQLTFSNFPAGMSALTATDIESIRQINAAGEVVATYHRDDVAMTMAGAVLTVPGAVFTNTDTFVVSTNIPRAVTAGAGGAGGGAIVYTNAAGDFTATVTNGAKTITITGLPFTLEAMHVVGGAIKKIAVTTNVVTAVPLTNVSVSGGVITLPDTDNFATGDIVMVTLIGPDKAYDTALDSQLVICQNPDYAHTTSVETLIDEADVAGTQLTADAGGSATSIVDATGAFTVASTAVGYIAYNVTEGTSATVTVVASGTAITTGAGVTDWSSDAYVLPLVKRYEINMDTYNFLTLHYYLRNGASLNTYLKIYGTLNSAATVDADTSWVDLSADIFGSAAGINCPASTTIEDIRIIDTPSTMLKYMVKLIVECSISSAQDNDYELYIKKSS